MNSLNRKTTTQLSALLIAAIFLSSCLEEAQVLSAEPSALELDNENPTCPGIDTLAVTSGPSITVNWSEASDNYSQASTLTYNVFMRKNSESYDLVSPAKIIVGATSTLISNGVAVGNNYTLFVTCSDEKGNSFPSGPQNERSIAVSDSQAPSQITNLTAGNQTFTSILLNWSPSDDGEGGTTAGNMKYKVYASTTATVSTAGAPITTVTNGGTSYLHTGLTPATTWFYRVVAVDQVGNLSADSNEASATTNTDVDPPVFAGNTSTTVVTGTSTSTISLSWTAATDNVTAAAQMRYRLYRCAGSTTCDPFSGSLVNTLTGATVATDSGLSASTVYVYGVRALDSSNNISTNTDKKITSTTYSSAGSFYSYATIKEVNIRSGRAVAVANVIGDKTGANAFPDLIVGATNASKAGSPRRFTGCMFVYAGTAAGAFSSTATEVVCQPNAAGNGNNNLNNFGTAIAVGDMDLDGIQDLVVSSPRQGKVFIFRTKDTAGTLSIGASPSVINHPGGTGTNSFGEALCIGDSDGVGADDIFVVTSEENCNGGCGSNGNGNVILYNNTSTAGVFIAPAAQAFKISPTQHIEGDGYNIQTNERVARSCTIGKFDPGNPSQIQLVVGSGTVNFGGGAGNDGMIAFYRKTAANTFVYQNVLPASTPLITNTWWGNAVSRIQLDGAGTDELVVGAPRDSTVGYYAGAAFTYTVSVNGSSDFVLTDTGDGFYGGSDLHNNYAGSALFAADIWAHGDGKEDLVLGAYLDDNTQIIGASNLDLGQTYTYKNLGSSIGTVVRQTNFDSSGLNARSGQFYGWSLCKGDVNNDGREDVMVGAPWTDFDPSTTTFGYDIGALYVYYGVVAGEIDFENPSQTLYPPGAQNSSTFGISCTVMDYNNDGKKDLVVGSAYRDVVQGNRGAVYVYYGDTNTPLPATNSASINSPTAVASALFGYSVTSGDWDNNGFDDLAVGAIGINSGSGNSGRVYVFWANNSSGAIETSNYTILNPPNGAYGSGTNPHLANTQKINADMNFGRAMASFPTKSGSLGKDLVICTLAYDPNANDTFSSSPARTNQGYCWIYYGKVNGGLAGNYQIMTVPKNDIRYPSGFSDPPDNHTQFGSGIGVGDWNNDGTSDLLVCASRQRNLITLDNYAGACWAYFGLPTGGFSQFSGWKPNDGGAINSPLPDAVHYNPNPEPSTLSYFGRAVTMLDINNNSSSDLVVGEPYSDSPSGPKDQGSDAGRTYFLRGGF